VTGNDGISVTGGVGGVTVSLEELAQLQVALKEIGCAILDVEAPLRKALEPLWDPAPALPMLREKTPETYPDLWTSQRRVLDMISSAGEGRLSPAFLAEQITDLIGGVEMAEDTYRATEEANAKSFKMDLGEEIILRTADVADAITPLAMSLIPPLGILGIYKLFTDPTNALLAMLGGEVISATSNLDDDYYAADVIRKYHPVLREAIQQILTPDVLSPLTIGTPSTQDEARALAIGANILLLGKGLRPGTATKIPVYGPFKPLRYLPDLVDGIDDVDVEGRAKDELNIGVTKFTEADGETSWLVQVPGTQKLTVGWGDNPADMLTNLAAVAQIANTVTAGIMSALTQAGVKKGEKVFFAGHSQGGIAATALAASAEFREKFTAGGVVTIGSPISSMDIPDDLQVLAFEHRQDPIPAISGPSNPDRLNFVTVGRNLFQATDQFSRDAVKDPWGMAAHNKWVYRETMDQAIKGGDPSVIKAATCFTPLFSRTAKVSVFKFSVKR